jgi:polysaccharide biosynthesis transport protein
MSHHDQPPVAVPPYTPPFPSLPSASRLDYEAEYTRDRRIQEYFYILLKRKWLIIAVFLGVFLLGALYTLMQTPQYLATAKIQITQDALGSQVTVGDRFAGMMEADGVEKFQQTQYNILESYSLAQRVVRALNLMETPQAKAIAAANPDQTKAEIEDKIVDGLLANLKVTPVKNTYLVDVSYQSPDKLLAQRVVNAIADEYMYLAIDRRNESFNLVRKWLNNQLQGMEGKVQEAQKKLYKFGQTTDIYTVEDKDNVVIQKFIDLSGMLTKAQAEKMAKEAQYNQVREKGPDAPLIVNNNLIALLRQQLVVQQSKVSSLQKVLRSGHPELQAEQANLNELQRRLQAEVKRAEASVKADYEAAARAERLIQDSFDNQKKQMVRLQDSLTEFQILKRDAQTNEQLYQALLARVKEASVAGTTVPTNVSVIDPARLPLMPFKPRTGRNLFMAGILGLTLGIGLALVLESLDDSIKSPDDLERFCLLPSLGVVPFQLSNDRKALNLPKKSDMAALRRLLPWRQPEDQDNSNGSEMDLVVYKHPMSRVSEAIGHVYSSLMLSTSGTPPCVVMVTSPNPSEGKSTIVTNLALSCALNDRSVVLIDCDLRKPRLHRVFGMGSQPGLTNYLTGNATLKEVLRSTPVPNLTIITAGATPPNPSILLNSEIFKELVNRLRQQFQHVFIDTPPVLGFADARFISVLADGVLLATKHNSTPKTAARLAHQLLNQSPILGAVLNAVDTFGQAYGTYSYHYNDKYYSKYYSDNQG